MRTQMMIAAAMCAAMCAVAADKDSKPVEPIVLPLKGTTVVEFVGIPAGEFTMGSEQAGGSCNNPSIIKLHKVTISRPFWMSKFKVTMEQWEAYKKVELTRYQQIMGGKSVPKSSVCFWEAIDFCEWLTKRCKAKLPRGYVVRLPTEAEWEYALRVNDDTWDDAGIWRGKAKDFAVDRSDIKRRAAENDYALPNIADHNYGPIAVGTKLPNAIGLYDMIGNGREFVLDTFDRTSFATLNKGWFPLGDEANIGKGLVYEDKEKDPLRHCKDTSKAIIITRNSCDWNPFIKLHENLDTRSPRNTIRLCIGPDLMKENRYSFRRNKKKK